MIKFKDIPFNQTKINQLRTSPKRFEEQVKKWKPCKKENKVGTPQNDSFSITPKSLKSFSKRSITVSCSVSKLDMFLRLISSALFSLYSLFKNPYLHS